MASQWKNLDSFAGLGKLNSHLGQNSYITGVEPTQDDVQVLQNLKDAPDSKKWPHISRWYLHIKSFGDKSKDFPSATTEKTPEPTEDEDDIDIFGEETEEEKLANEKRANEMKEEAKKKGPVLRSAVVLDVKPEGSETDLDELEKKVREIAIEGLEWKASERVNVGYGIKKLRIMCYIVDALVSPDSDIIPIIEEWEDLVQSVDTHSFTKI